MTTACGDDSAVSGGTDTDTTTGTGTGTDSTTGTTGTPPTTSLPTTSGNSGTDSATDSATGSTSTTGPTTGVTTTGTTGMTGTTTGTTGNVGECQVDADCDTLFGPAPCGAWTCNQNNFACEASAPGCSDADQDGYGVGANCSCNALDCDDSDDAIADDAVLSCYSGPPNTDGVGTCHAGTSTCTAGVVGPCVGEVGPSGEACNDEDDDCDGQVDDDLGSFSCGLGACATTVPACTNGVVGQCVPAAGAASDGPMCNGADDDCDGPVDEDCKVCVPVTLNGNDMTADGTFNNPFRTIQAAINWTVNNNGPTNVCVASGPQCGATGTFTNAANTTVTMADGISVLGKYESTNWTRCNNSTTVIQPQTGAGVTFPDSVQSPTVLDGFRVDRYGGAQTTAGVTVDGATGAILANITISNTPDVANSYGVNVIGGGEATITRGRIDAGNGKTESIGVRVVGSKLVAQDNCLSPNAQGRCDDFCANNPSFRGRTTPGTGVTYALLLQDAPGSLVQSSAMCANDADQGAAVRIAGDGTGIVIRGNLVNAFGGAQDSHGIWMEDCGGAAPWIVDNHYIAAAGDNQQSRVDGVRAIGDCHPVIDSNVSINGGGEGQASNPNGVHCGAAQGVASKCVVLGNQLIRGSDFGYPPIATGVRCDDGGCMRIEDNLITGRGGQTSYGVFLQKTGSFVARNRIRGGCSGSGTGLHAEDAYARIENNFVVGYSSADCAGNPPNNQTSTAMRVLLAQGVNEVDIHSNTVDAGGINGGCTGRALELGTTGMAPAAGVGVFRNNIFRAGTCTGSKMDVVEMVAAADPRIFEHNMLDSSGNPAALYLDENNNALAMAAQVDALADMIVSGTLAGNAMLVMPPTDLHIAPGSPCADAGTPTGAPSVDIDGATRDASPDVGADEL